MIVSNRKDILRALKDFWREKPILNVDDAAMKEQKIKRLMDRIVETTLFNEVHVPRTFFLSQTLIAVSLQPLTGSSRVELKNNCT